MLGYGVQPSNRRSTRRGRGVASPPPRSRAWTRGSMSGSPEFLRGPTRSQTGRTVCTLPHAFPSPIVRTSGHLKLCLSKDRYRHKNRFQGMSGHTLDFERTSRTSRPEARTPGARRARTRVDPSPCCRRPATQPSSRPRAYSRAGAGPQLRDHRPPRPLTFPRVREGRHAMRRTRHDLPFSSAVTRQTHPSAPF
jgi:hypothetical protein